MKRLPLLWTIVIAFNLQCVRGAAAQTWPTRPVTMVVPFAAGGPIDTIGRILAPRLSEILGQQVIIEDIGGAGGMIGASRVSKAAPDGYEFVLGTSATHAQNQTLYKNPLGAARNVVGIWCGAISGNMKVSFQAARSIG